MDEIDRLKYAFGLSGLTQAQLGERIGVAQSAVSQWLTGARRPDRATLTRLADVIGAEPAWLEYGVGEGPRPDEAAERAVYRNAMRWVFRPENVDGSRDYGNANIFALRPSLSTFVREVLQNVVDAGVAGRARASLCVRRLRGDDLARFLEAFGWRDFVAHLEASIASGQQVGAALSEGYRSATSGELILLEISDEETSGLVGPEFNDGSFAALCRNNLQSSKASGTAGGSYGLGKSVLWRMSSLSTVLFVSNLREAEPESGNSERRFIGRSELVWHAIDQQGAFAGPGFLGQPDESMPGRCRSYWANETLLSDLFIDRPEVPGTSIAVVGFRDPSEDAGRLPADTADELEKAVATHFWPALTEGTLSVAIQVAEGRQHVRNAEVDVETHEPTLADLLRQHRRDEVVEQLLEPGDVVRIPISLDVPSCTSGGHTHDGFTHMVQLLVRRASSDDDSANAGYVQYFRGAGMVVMAQDVGRVLPGAQPFHAAVLCGLAAGSTIEDEWADRFLRAAEPPSHSDWEITEKVRREYGRGAGASIARMRDAVRAAVRDALLPSVAKPDDGPRDLSALFKLGNPPQPERAPRMTVDSAVLADDGAWRIEATIRVPHPSMRVAGRPVVVFEGETGAGSPVRWASLTPVSNCAIEGESIRVAAGKRTARFRGVTDIGTHPAPSNNVRIGVQFRALREAVS